MHRLYECPLTNGCRVGGEPVIYLCSRFIVYDVASSRQTQFRLLFYLSILHDTWCHIWNGFFFFFFSKGNFTCLEVVFVLKRRLGYYMFHTYIPTCLIVVMSVSISFLQLLIVFMARLLGLPIKILNLIKLCKRLYRPIIRNSFFKLINLSDFAHNN